MFKLLINHLIRQLCMLLGYVILEGGATVWKQYTPYIREKVLTRGVYGVLAHKYKRSIHQMAVDIPLLLYLGFWYLGNYYYNIQNKNAAIALGGEQFALTLAAAQLAIGVAYAIFLWVAPDARKAPNVTFNDILKMVPVGICSAIAHFASVYSLAAGGVAFAQIVKAAEPAFAAVIGTTLYGKKLSTYRYMCLIPIIGGVILAALKQNKDGSIEMDFTMGSLVGSLVADLFAAFKANENKKLMETPGLKDRIGSVGNQFAIMTLLSVFITLPVMMVVEGKKLPIFWDKFQSDSTVFWNVIWSGLTFYSYNELSTLTLTKISVVSQSIANTAKRVVVIIGCAIVFNESFSGLKAIGCAICIFGVFLDSIIDDVMTKKPPSVKKD